MLHNLITRLLPPEFAHNMMLEALKRGYGPNVPSDEFPGLKQKLFGLEFNNPVSIAAGFDKNAIAVNGVEKMGVGFIEVGSVTWQPRTGNRKPRLFRLNRERSIINNMGLNNLGAYDVLRNVQNVSVKCPLGVNIAAENEDDFLYVMSYFDQICDYYVLNISCPNVSNSRPFLNPFRLADLLSTLKDNMNEKKPIMLKFPCDIPANELCGILDVVIKHETDAVIIGNSTSHYPANLTNKYRKNPGGLSGALIYNQSIHTLRMAKKYVQNNLILIGVGGIMNGADAYLKIRAGANLVQLYTGFAFKGPKLIKKINTDIVKCLENDGFDNIQDAVGKSF